MTSFLLCFHIPRSATTTVFVYLNDTNDECPYFRASSYNGRITPQDLYVVTGSGGTERLVIDVLDNDTVSHEKRKIEAGQES